MKHYALLKGRVTQIVKMDLVDKYMKRGGLIPRISARNSHPRQAIDARDIGIVYVDIFNGYLRIVGGEHSAPK